MGRPSKMDEIAVKKLEEAFAWGCTDEEACFYAGISRVTLNTFQNKNKEFLNKKKILKANPIFKARVSVFNNLDKDAHLAFKFLERKLPEEFGPRTKVDGTFAVTTNTKFFPEEVALGQEAL